jgi:MinD superfamily P-loop ATPase
MAALEAVIQGLRGGGRFTIRTTALCLCCTICITQCGAAAMKLEIKKIGNSTGLILPK